jgi:hypothetical protein
LTPVRDAIHDAQVTQMTGNAVHALDVALARLATLSDRRPADASSLVRPPPTRSTAGRSGSS